MTGTLYLVATPIGNLEDITLRALRVLKEAAVIAAEDTRHTLKLLSHYQIQTPLVAYHQHSDAGRTEFLVQRLLAGESIALVTDAGTPGVSDPGFALASAAIAAGVPVVPVPGASAALCALIASGLPTARFAFEGFLPRTRSSRLMKLKALAIGESRTLIFYEAGNRTDETLAEMAVAFGGGRHGAVCRELTKKHEEIVRGTLEVLAAVFRERGGARGEVTIVVDGLGSSHGDDEAPDLGVDSCAAEPKSVDQALRDAIAAGLTERDAVRQVSESRNLSRREVYAMMLALKDEGMSQ